MPKIAGRSSRLLLIICLGLLFLPACAPIKAAGAPPTLKIGLVAPFEGLYRPLGYETLFGVKLALQEYNQRDGLNGYKIELVALNDFDEPDQAKIQAEALAADPDVVGVVGHLSTAATQAAIPIYQQADLAVVIPWTWTTAVADSGLDRSGVVSVAATKAETTAKLAQLAQAAGYRQVVTVTAAQLGPLTPAVEAILLDTDAVTAGEFIVAWQLAGQARPIFGQPDVGSGQLVQVAGPAANGLIYVSPGPAPADIAADRFRAAYQALAGFPPGPRAVLAYEAANVLLAAIDRALHEGPAPAERGKVKAAINQIQLAGLTGPIAFDGQGRRLNAPLWVYQISNEAYPGTLIGSR
jgi:branched-chain amino acid transport system substrate-binding protein